jgi:hypothetical protein
MPVLEERGLFWLSDTPVPEGQFAPDGSIAGTLTVDDDGYVSLELDSYFPTKHGPFSVLNEQGKPLGKDIYGVLRASNNRVILTGVMPNGGQVKTNGISYQEFVATDCLVGSFDFSSDQLALTSDTLEIELLGFEDWFWLRSIKVSRTDERISADYERPSEATYEVSDETLTFDFDVTGTAPYNFGDEFSIKQKVTLRFSLGLKEPLEKLRDRFRFFEELLILLTDSEYRLPWPRVALDAETKVRWYFGRFRPNKAAEAPKLHTCLTHFPKVRDAFGDIWSNWKRKREEFGPGFYLYLGTRRGLSLYPEHRFVNLIWGVEAFHRTKHPADPEAMAERTERIVEQVSDEKDKRLVRRQLRFAREPTLATRIVELFETLPIELEKKRLRAFADACAKARNDISHYGAHRGPDSYSDFALDLEKRSAALSTLCHCLLLHEIGVSKEILTNWVQKGWGAFRIKYHFVAVGLLDKEVLNQSTSPAEPAKEGSKSE